MRTIPTGQPLGPKVASARHNQRIWRLGAWILHPMHRLLSPPAPRRWYGRRTVGDAGLRVGVGLLECGPDRLPDEEASGERTR